MRRNKKDYLIVDGYNIINAWDELKEIAISDLEHAREKLIDAIIEYAEFTGRLGIIVFDAYNIKSCKEKIEKSRLICFNILILISFVTHFNMNIAFF